MLLLSTWSSVNYIACTLHPGLVSISFYAIPLCPSTIVNLLVYIWRERERHVHTYFTASFYSTYLVPCNSQISGKQVLKFEICPWKVVCCMHTPNHEGVSSHHAIHIMQWRYIQDRGNRFRDPTQNILLLFTCLHLLCAIFICMVGCSKFYAFMKVFVLGFSLAKASLILKHFVAGRVVG